MLRSRCLPYGDGITFWPLAQIIRQASGLTDDTAPIDARTRLDATLDGAPRGVEVAATLASLLGLERAAGAAEDMGWAIRLFLAHLARERPLIVVVEDIHWAEPGLLDVLEATVDWTRDAPILILCPTRLDLLDARPALFVGRDNVTALRLLPLAADDTGVLIDVLPGGSALPAALRHRIEEVSEGNPLYVEEMLGMLVDDGRLRRDGEGWAAAPELGTLTVPVSVQALIAARIDALAFAERRVAERASVVGREFERSAVAALTPAEERKALSGLLLSLTRKELIGTAEPGLSRDDVFRFRHILIRDAAYERLPKRDRADLHARLADWLEGISGDGRGDLLEILSYHLAEAIRFRAEIGMDRDEELIERALTALSETAARADRSHRYADVAELLLRKVAVLEQAGGGSATIDSALEVRLRAAEAAHLGGHSDLAISVIGEVISQVDAMGNPSRSGSAHERLGTYLVEAERTAEALAAYERSLELLIEPSLLRARALASLGRLHMLIDRYDDAQRVLEEALQIPSTAGMDSIRASAMTSLGTVLNESGAWQEGINWIRRGLEQARAADDGFEIVRAYNNLGGALERAGEIAASVAIFEEGHAEIVRRRLTHVAPRLLANWSFNLLLMGRVNEAEVRARQALELGPSDDFVLNIWDRLGAALLFAGRLDEADEAYVRAGSSADRAWAIGRQLSAFELRMGFGRILAAKGEFDAADATFREAVPHDLGGFPLAELPDLVAEAAGNRANQATRLRRAGDVAHASDVAASAEGWRQEFVRLWPTNVEPSPRLRPALAIIDAEVERAWGRPDPVAWTRVVAAARSVGMRLAEAYAQFRFTEALAETGRPIAEITDALVAALTLSRELGTGLYTSQIEALADRLRLRVPTFAEPTS